MKINDFCFLIWWFVPHILYLKSLIFNPKSFFLSSLFVNNIFVLSLKMTRLWIDWGGEEETAKPSLLLPLTRV